MSAGVQEGQGARRKNKFVPLYSQEGKEKLVIRIPGRQSGAIYLLSNFKKSEDFIENFFY